MIPHGHATCTHVFCHVRAQVRIDAPTVMSGSAPISGRPPAAAAGAVEESALPSVGVARGELWHWVVRELREVGAVLRAQAPMMLAVLALAFAVMWSKGIDMPGPFRHG